MVQVANGSGIHVRLFSEILNAHIAAGLIFFSINKWERIKLKAYLAVNG